MSFLRRDAKLPRCFDNPRPLAPRITVITSSARGRSTFDAAFDVSTAARSLGRCNEIESRELSTQMSKEHSMDRAMRRRFRPRNRRPRCRVRRSKRLSRDRREQARRPQSRRTRTARIGRFTQRFQQREPLCSRLFCALFCEKRSAPAEKEAAPLRFSLKPPLWWYLAANSCC